MSCTDQIISPRWWPLHLLWPQVFASRNSCHMISSTCIEINISSLLRIIKCFIGHRTEYKILGPYYDMGRLDFFKIRKVKQTKLRFVSSNINILSTSYFDLIKVSMASIQSIRMTQVSLKLFFCRYEFTKLGPSTSRNLRKGKHGTKRIVIIKVAKK